MNYSTSICPFESGRFGKEGKKLQNFKYLKNDKSFLDEMKNIYILKFYHLMKKEKIDKR